MLDLVRNALKRVLKVAEGPPEVPLGEHPEVFRASDKHLTYLLVAWAIRTGVLTFSLFIPVVVAVAALVHESHDVVAAAVGLVFGGGFLVVAFCGYAAIRLDWEMRWYVLTDRSLRIREGIVFAREVTLTLANVQDLKVMQGPIQRALGIMDLVVDTAGGGAAAAAKGSISSHEGVLRGVDRGGDLRDKISTRVKQRRGAGLGDPDEHHEHHDADSSFIDALRAVRDEAKRLRGAV